MMQRQEVHQMLALDDQERLTQDAVVAQARDARVAAREARIDADEKLRKREQWLQSMLSNLVEHYEAKRREVKFDCGRRLQAQRQLLTDTQRATLQSVELQSKQLQSAALAEEQARFDIQLRRLVASDEAATEDFHTQAQKLIKDMEQLYRTGEEEQTIFERKRELVTLQDVQTYRAQELASNLLQEARLEFSERMGLDEVFDSS